MADAATDADLQTALRREEKRRRAAEQVAVRLRADVAARDTSLDALRADIDGLRADVVKAEDEVAELRAELVDLRIEARHARDREAAAKATPRRSTRRATTPAVVDQVAAAPPDRTGVAPEAVGRESLAPRVNSPDASRRLLGRPRRPPPLTASRSTAGRSGCPAG